MPGKKSIKFKSLEFKDLDQIMEIEKLSNPTPWSIGSFIDCINSSYQNIVILQDDLLLGFCISTVNFTESGSIIATNLPSSLSFIAFSLLHFTLSLGKIFFA